MITLYMNFFYHHVRITKRDIIELNDDKHNNKRDLISQRDVRQYIRGNHDTQHDRDQF